MRSDLKRKHDQKTLEEVVDIFDKLRKPIKKSERVEGIYPYYGASGITDYVEEYIFNGTYILLSEDGDNLKTQNSPIAFLAKGKFWVNNHAHVLKAKSNYSTEFLCYALQIADIKSFISGSTRPKLTQKDIKKIPVYSPTYREQKKIAHILGTLDEKIELNRKTNATLEAIAQALFQSWFVDFDPIIDNALEAGNTIPKPLQTKAENRRTILASGQYPKLPERIRQQFPNSFAYSEILEKWVPQGWDAKRIEEVSTVIGGGTPSKKFQSILPMTA